MAAKQNGSHGEQIGPEKRLSYTLPEAGGLVGVPWYVLRDAYRRGELTLSRPGKRLVVEHAELEAFLRRKRV